MIDGFEPPSPPNHQRVQRLGEFAQAFDKVQRTLRTERDFREMKLQAALTESEIGYWRGRVDEVQAAIDALVRMKNLGKIALLEQSVSVVEEWGQPELIGGAVDKGKLGY